MALQVPVVLLVIKEKWEWKELKEILVLQDKEVMQEIEDHEEEQVSSYTTILM